jgi:hypothetical protein
LSADAILSSDCRLVIIPLTVCVRIGNRHGGYSTICVISVYLYAARCWMVIDELLLYSVECLHGLSPHYLPMFDSCAMGNSNTETIKVFDVSVVTGIYGIAVEFVPWTCGE